MNNLGYGNPPVEHQFQPGQSGNPRGREKGSKNLCTIVRELENEDFDWSLIPLKAKEVVAKYGSPWRAIVCSAIGKALDGDMRAAEWLRRSAYGNGTVTEGDSSKPHVIYISDIKSRIVEPMVIE